MTPAGHAATVRKALDRFDGYLGVHTGAGEDCPTCDRISAAAIALDALQAQAEAGAKAADDACRNEAAATHHWARAQAAEAERDRLAARVSELEDALDTIESSPEKPLEVQAIARAALAGQT